MSNKRDREKAAQRSAAARAKAGVTEGGSGTGKSNKSQPPPMGIDLFPPMRHSLSHGLAAASCSPVVIILPMLFVPLLWFIMRACGLEVFPQSMVHALAIPPVSTFTDYMTASRLFAEGSVPWILFLLGTTILRGVFLAVMVGLLDEALTYRSVSRLGFLRGLNALIPVGIYAYVSLGVVLTGTLVARMLGQGIGFSVLILTMVGGLMFLGFAPAVAVRSGVPTSEVLQRSFRAARLPGWPRHMMLAVVYYFVATFMMPLANPGFAIITTNPSTGSVASVLVATFINMVFLAAIVDSYRVVEDYVPASPPRKRR